MNEWRNGWLDGYHAIWFQKLRPAQITAPSFAQWGWKKVKCDNQADEACVCNAACILLVLSAINALLWFHCFLVSLIAFQYLHFNGSKEIVTMFAMNANYGSIILSVSYRTSLNSYCTYTIASLMTSQWASFKKKKTLLAQVCRA